MFGILKLARRFVAIPAVVGVAFGVWLTLRSQPVPLGYWRETVLARAASRAVSEMPSARAGDAVLVFPFEGDPDDYVRDAVSRRIQSSGKYQVRSQGWMEKLLGSSSLDRLSVGALDRAIETAGRLGIRFVLLGSVTRFEDLAGSGADLRLAVRLADATEKRTVWSGEIAETLAPCLWSPAYIRARLAAVHWLVRVFLWIVAAGLLPIVLLPWLRWIVGRRSNVANLGCWVLLAAVSTSAAWFLTAPGLPSWGVGLLLSLALIVSLGYNLLVLGELARVIS